MEDSAYEKQLIYEIIFGIFQEYSKNYFINQLSLLGRIFNDIFLFMQRFFMFFVPFLLEYSKNIWQVRPCPTGAV